MKLWLNGTDGQHRAGMHTIHIPPSAEKNKDGTPVRPQHVVVFEGGVLDTDDRFDIEFLTKSGLAAADKLDCWAVGRPGEQPPYIETAGGFRRYVDPVPVPAAVPATPQKGA